MLVLSVPVLSCPDHHVHHDHHDQHDQRDQHDHGNHGEVGGCTQGSWRLSGPNARALPRRSLWMMNNEWLTHTVTYIWRYRPALAAKMSLTDWVIGNREKQSNRQGASKSKIAEDRNRVLGFVDSLYIESILWTEIMSSASNTIRQTLIQMLLWAWLQFSCHYFVCLFVPERNYKRWNEHIQQQ